MKHLFNRLIALFLSLSIAFQSIACAWSPYMEYEMLFDRNFVFNHAASNTTYNAWFYNQDQYNETNVSAENGKHWADYLENVYSVDDLKKIIYRPTNSFTTIEKELKKLRSKRLSDKMIGEKEVFFISFIGLALRVEKVLADNTPDPWAELPQTIDLNNFEPLIQEVTSLIQQTNDPTKQMRYAYQLIKLYRYSKQFKNVESTFKIYFEGSQSFLSYWAMEQYAGCLALEGKVNEANYLFAKVYVNCPSKRMSSYLSVQLSTEEDFKNTLLFCTNQEEKMALHYMRAMRTKSLALSDMQSITQSLGNHEYARVVMAHEINKLEKILLKRKGIYESNEQNLEEKNNEDILKNQLATYLKELIVFNQQMVTGDSTDAFWKLSLAYLYYLDHQHQECSDVLAKIQPITDNIQKQHDVIFIVNYLETKSVLTEIDENIIGNKLFSLNKNNPSYPYMHQAFSDNGFTNGSFLIEEYNTINEFIFSKIEARYRTKNKFVSLIFSGLTIDSDLYNEFQSTETKKTPTIDDVTLLINDLQRTPETKLSLFASSYYFNVPNDAYVSQKELRDFDYCEAVLKEFKASLLMRHPDRLKDAIQLLSSLPDNMKNSNVVIGNPFKFSIKNPDFEKFNEKKYEYETISKLEFANRLFELYQNKKSAMDFYKLGLGYYNSSYYGLQWEGMAHYRCTYEPNGFYTMEVCQYFLNKALEMGGFSREKEAEILFMLARCEQNNYTLTHGSFPEDYKSDDFVEENFSKYFNEMKNQGKLSNFNKLRSSYSNTRFYNELVKECKYFEYYVN
jgi:hypothetical protein